MNRLQALLIVVAMVAMVGCQPSAYRTPNEVSMAAYRRSVGLDRRTPLAGEAQPFEWIGVARTSSGVEPVAVVYVLRANDVSGHYYLGERGGAYGHSGTGILSGLFSKDVLSLEVSRSQGCVWKFTGVITGDRLQGRGQPTFCPGAQEFEWDLKLDTP